MTHSLTKSSKNTHTPPWPADTTTPISSPIGSLLKQPIHQYNPCHLYFPIEGKEVEWELVSTTK
jgi:hypothetical protein